jgi:hypothetical protein
VQSIYIGQLCQIGLYGHVALFAQLYSVLCSKKISAYRCSLFTYLLIYMLQIVTANALTRIPAYTQQFTATLHTSFCAGCESNDSSLVLPHAAERNPTNSLGRVGLGICLTSPTPVYMLVIYEASQIHLDELFHVLLRAITQVLALIYL